MEKLLQGTIAYKIFKTDVESGKLSHAYMLHFADRKNLRAALKFFAVRFFGDLPPNRIYNESYTDFTLYPAEGAKITVDGVSELIEDSSLRPVEGDKKLYAVCNFEEAAAIVQNKLLKTLEEPLAGVHFILGVTSLAPVLDTVKSRVKLLEIPPFGEEEIFAALQREGQNPLNREAAASCNGILGDAQNMVKGDWFAAVREAAAEICSATKIFQIAEISKKYGETKYKKELLAEVQQIYFSALCGKTELDLSKHTLIYALELLNEANADLKFNAVFGGLLYDFMLRVAEENEKWQKLRE